MIKFDNSDQILRLDTIDIQKEQLYTLFVIPKKKKYLTDLMLVKATTTVITTAATQTEILIGQQ